MAKPIVRPTITAERLKESLSYDESTGEFRWKLSNGSRAVVGAVAGYMDKRKGCIVGIDGHEFAAARLAWLYVYGELPKRAVIHKDGDNRNCAIGNLASPCLPKATKLTVDRLKELVHYDPATGEFTWAAHRSAIALKGSSAGHLSPESGYVLVRIDMGLYRAHRLAWFYTTGEWPKHHIDHINGNRADNRISNLRDAGPAINSQNQRRPRSDNASGFLGVCWAQEKKKWKAQISANGKNRHLGYADTAEEAHEIYLAAKRQLHEGCTI